MLPHNILEEMRFRAIEAHQAAKVSGRSRSCWVYIGEVCRVGLQNGGGMDRGLLRNARRQAGRPNWIASNTAKQFKLVKHPATQYGYEHPLWICQRIGRVISAELNLVVSVPTLWRELKKLKLKLPKT